MCKIKTPKQQPAEAPAPAPAPAQPSAAVVQAGAENEDTSPEALDRAKRKGRSSLRIPLNVGGAGGGSGLTLPVG